MSENLNIYFKNADCKVSVGGDEQGITKSILRNPQQYFAKAKKSMGKWVCMD